MRQRVGRCRAVERLTRAQCLPQEVIDLALVPLTPEQRAWTVGAADHRLRDHQPLHPDVETVALIRKMIPAHREEIARGLLGERDDGAIDAVKTAVWLLDLNQERSAFLYDWMRIRIAELKVGMRQKLAARFSIPPDAVDATVDIRGLDLVVRGQLEADPGSIPC